MNEAKFPPSSKLTLGLANWLIGDLDQVFNGHFYWSVIANFTQIPFLGQVSDSQIICTLPDQYQPDLHQNCSPDVVVDFGKIGYLQTKQRELYITNPMNEDIYIYDIEKMLKFDDLIVY